MLVKPTLEELLPKVESRYTLAILVAKRARQLVDGAQPMAESESPNLVTLACEEVLQDKVACVLGLHHPKVPLRPEVEEARRLAKELKEKQANQDYLAEAEELLNKKAKEESILAKAKIVEDNLELLATEEMEIGETLEVLEDVIEITTSIGDTLDIIDTIENIAILEENIDSIQSLEDLE